MALPDFQKDEVGSAISWTSSGGTYGITLTSVTNGNGRQGAKGDLGANRAPLWDIFFQSKLNATATAGLELELYWAASDSATAGTNNPGGTSGTDATFNTTPSEYKAQLIFIGSLILSNNATTSAQAQRLGPFSPPCRYGMPVVVNSSGQTLSSTGTDHVITLTPRERAIEDTA